MLIPTGPRVLIKPDPVETKTKSGIVLAVDAKREGAASVTGIVVRLGELAFKEFVGGDGGDVHPDVCHAGSNRLGNR